MGIESFFASTAGLFVLVSIIFILLLWILLPFAVFGVKDLLREHIGETRGLRNDIQALIEATNGDTATYKEDLERIQKLLYHQVKAGKGPAPAE